MGRWGQSTQPEPDEARPGTVSLPPCEVVVTVEVAARGLVLERAEVRVVAGGCGKTTQLWWWRRSGWSKAMTPAPI